MFSGEEAGVPLERDIGACLSLTDSFPQGGCYFGVPWSRIAVQVWRPRFHLLVSGKNYGLGPGFAQLLEHHLDYSLEWFRIIVPIGTHELFGQVMMPGAEVLGQVGILEVIQGRIELGYDSRGLVYIIPKSCNWQFCRRCEASGAQTYKNTSSP